MGYRGVSILISQGESRIFMSYCTLKLRTALLGQVEWLSVTLRVILQPSWSCRMQRICPLLQKLPWLWPSLVAVVQKSVVQLFTVGLVVGGCSFPDDNCIRLLLLGNEAQDNIFWMSLLILSFRKMWCPWISGSAFSVMWSRQETPYGLGAGYFVLFAQCWWTLTSALRVTGAVLPFACSLWAHSRRGDFSSSSLFSQHTLSSRWFFISSLHWLM